MFGSLSPTIEPFGDQPRGDDFVPTDLSGLTLWLRADMGITLNGSNVSAWADQSGAGNHFTQGTAANQPAFSASVAALGNRPAVTCDGTNDVLTGPAMSAIWAAGAKFIAIAFVATSIATNSANSFANDAPIADQMGGFGCIFLRSNGTVGFYVWDGADKNDTQSIVAGTAQAFLAKHESSTIKTAKSNATWSTGVAANNTTDLTNAMGIGAQAATVAFFTGSIAEIIACNQAPSDALAARCAAYLVSRYSLS